MRADLPRERRPRHQVGSTTRLTVAKGERRREVHGRREVHFAVERIEIVDGLQLDQRLAARRAVVAISTTRHCARHSAAAETAVPSEIQASSSALAARSNGRMSDIAAENFLTAFSEPRVSATKARAASAIAATPSARQSDEDAEALEPPRRSRRAMRAARVRRRPSLMRRRPLRCFPQARRAGG